MSSFRFRVCFFARFFFYSFFDFDSSFSFSYSLFFCFCFRFRFRLCFRLRFVLFVLCFVKVYSCFRTGGGRAVWYRGRVTTCHRNGTADVRYDDVFFRYLYFFPPERVHSYANIWLFMFTLASHLSFYFSLSLSHLFSSHYSHSPTYVVVSQIRGRIGGPSSPPPSAVRPSFFLREKFSIFFPRRLASNCKCHTWYLWKG